MPGHFIRNFFRLGKSLYKPKVNLIGVPVQRTMTSKSFYTSQTMSHVCTRQSFFKISQPSRMFSHGPSKDLHAQYLGTKKDIDLILQNKQFNYDACVSKLEELMTNTFKALNDKTNPVVNSLVKWDESDIKLFIKEYSGFTKETIHMFLDAMIKVDWPLVKKEIERNMGEEMGALTDGIPHLELMRRGYSLELGIETENVSYTDVTINFIKKMRSFFQKTNNAFVCGALLAFEATATDEFKNIAKTLRTLKALQHGVIKPESLLGRYIAGHVSDEGLGSNPEDGHHEGMKMAMREYITQENAEDFTKGFLSVCIALNTWWEEIALEIYAQKLYGQTLSKEDEVNTVKLRIS